MLLNPALRLICGLPASGAISTNPRYFDYFAENNLIHHFAKFLEQKGNRRGDVAKQVLQTLSILIQNIRSTTAIFYLFSNNVVNEIVAMRFDFEDDEVLGYFINLLKTISSSSTAPPCNSSSRTTASAPPSRCMRRPSSLSTTGDALSASQCTSLLYASGHV